VVASKRSRTTTSSLAVKQKLRKGQKKRSPYNLRPRQLAPALDATELGTLLAAIPNSGQRKRTKASVAALSAAGARSAATSPRARASAGQNPARGAAATYLDAVVSGTATSSQTSLVEQLVSIIGDQDKTRRRCHDLEEEVAVLKAEKDSLMDLLKRIGGGSRDGGLELHGGDPADSGSDLSRGDLTDGSADGESELSPEYDLRDMLNALRAKATATTPTVHSGSAKQLRSIAAKPSHFDGKTNRQGVRDWLAGLKEYILLVADTCTPEEQVRLAATFLKDNALRVWQNERAVLPAAHRGSWDMFEQVMLDRYDTGTDAVTARYQLDALQQRDNQSMVSFIQIFDVDQLCS
jgi:hypothetical protein